MEFHAERDSAEVMKAIEQGGALTTLLETVVIDIAPDIVDLIIAAFFLYWKFNAYVSLASKEIPRAFHFPICMLREFQYLF
jgi:ABC-type transport system involved in Fe-S cluster assembly fused permease/ATPase subunit